LNGALERASAQAGVDAAGAQIIRASENVLYRLSGHIVARVGRRGTVAAAEREIKIATWLRDHDFPAVRPVAKLDQPQMVEGIPVTFWEELPAHRQGRMSELALLLRQLHQLPAPAGFDPGQLAPLIRVRERIESATIVNEQEREWLRERAERLAHEWATLPVGLPQCVVHGDAWVGNVAVTEDGIAVLLDFERCALGPPEWDLVHSAIKFTSFGWAEGQYEEFVAAYGYDVTTYQGFRALRDIRELRMTTFALQCALEDSTYAPEARLRLDCLRGKHGPRPWRGWHPTP
jgi:aminoglycoside phosphotransferase (APT) family kinase protein